MVRPSTGSVHGTNRTPSNLYMPWDTDVSQRKPSEVCTTENMPAGTEPSCIRHDVCMYWVRRLFGSRAWAVAGSNNTQVRQAARVATIAVRGRLSRSKSCRREAVFPMLCPRSARQRFMQKEEPGSFRLLPRVVRTLSASNVKPVTKRLSPAFQNCRRPGAGKWSFFGALRGVDLPTLFGI